MFGVDSKYFEDILLFHGSVDRVMGTKFDLVISGTEKKTVDSIWLGTCEDLMHYEKMLNRFDPSSEVAEVNCGSAAPGPELSVLIGMCDKYRERTEGCFDITKGSGKTGYDFGGFAKGFILRLLLQKMKEAGVSCALADFGQSSFFAVGNHPFGGPWKASLKDPYSGRALRDIEVVDCSISVSGNTPGYSGHIIDPETGCPVESRKLVVVKTDDPLDAEILSTALMVAGEGRKKEILATFSGTEVDFYDL